MAAVGQSTADALQKRAQIIDFGERNARLQKPFDHAESNHLRLSIDRSTLNAGVLLEKVADVLLDLRGWDKSGGKTRSRRAK